MVMHTTLWVAGLAVLGIVVSAQDSSPPSPAGSGAAGRQQLLPTGTLRAGINAGNALTRAVGAQLARELARRLGAEAVLVEYPTPGAVTDAVGKEWDVAFIAADPERTGTLAFTPAYVELDATYLVRDASIRTVADVDRAGATIATPQCLIARPLAKMSHNSSIYQKITCATIHKMPITTINPCESR
jgi:hypothetical protein